MNCILLSILSLMGRSSEILWHHLFSAALIECDYYCLFYYRPLSSAKNFFRIDKRCGDGAIGTMVSRLQIRIHCAGNLILCLIDFQLA